MGHLDEAIDDYTSALQFDPTLAARCMDGGWPGSRRVTYRSSTDISAAKTIQFKIVDDFTRMAYDKISIMGTSSSEDRCSVCLANERTANS